MGLDAPWHWIVLALIVIALFGYKRMPEMAKSVARSLRVFKTEMKGFTDDDKAPAVAPQTPPVAVPVVTPPVVAPPLVATPTPVAPAAVPSTVVVPGTNGALPAAPHGPGAVSSG